MKDDSNNQPILMQKIGDLIAEKMGIYFTPDKSKELQAKLFDVAKELGFSSVKACIEALLQSSITSKEMSVLAKHLTIGETYFFRDPYCFQLLEQVILPELIQSRSGKVQALRIWSAACSTGEEAYSVAMLLKKLLPDIKNWNISILATDINSSFLQKAQAGKYSEWSFRSAPEIKNLYFQKEKDGYVLCPSIKNMVKFMELNLVEDLYPSLANGTNAMDVILCNNVLIYFSDRQVKRVVQQLTSSLAEGGHFICSAIEVPYIHDSRLTACKHRQTIYFQKQVSYSAPLIEEVCQLVQKTSLSKTETTSIKVKPFSFPSVQRTTLAVCNYETALKAYHNGLYEDSIEILEDCLETNPHQGEKEKILLIKAYANQGDIQSAFQWCEKSLKTNKLNPVFYYLHAQILEEFNQQEKAIESLKKALYLDSNFVMAHFSMGNLLMKQNRLKEANRHFRNVLDLLTKNFSSSHELLGEDTMPPERLRELVTSLMR